MRAFVLAIALFVAVSAAPVQDEIPIVDGYKNGTDCPALFFYDNCKFCICQENGKNADCILFMCPPGVTEVVIVEKLPHIDNFDEVGQCHAGKTFYDSCNACQCSIDGFEAVCNRMLCSYVEKPHIDGYKLGMKCGAPGRVFYDECKTCKCNADGVSATCSETNCDKSEVSTAAYTDTQARTESTVTDATTASAVSDKSDTHAN